MTSLTKNQKPKTKKEQWFSTQNRKRTVVPNLFAE